MPVDHETLARCEKLMTARRHCLMHMADAIDALRLGRTDTALTFVEAAHRRLRAADEYVPTHCDPTVQG